MTGSFVEFRREQDWRPMESTHDETVGAADPGFGLAVTVAAISPESLGASSRGPSARMASARNITPLSLTQHAY